MLENMMSGLKVFCSQDESLCVVLPDQQLREQSVQIVAPNKALSEWSKKDHAHSYSLMQRVTQLWKNSGMTDQYFIYGKIDSTPFHWEMVPYHKCESSLGRIAQQLQVLWRTIFGGIEVTPESKTEQLNQYQLLLNQAPAAVEPLNVSREGDDPFCKKETIVRQWVVTGKKVNVLFNYAPIGFGKDKLHFLVVPKAHREMFTDVTKEEYCEALALTTRLVDHFSKTREIKNVYLLNSNGKDAGQTVKHWHLHVIFSTSSAHDWWGKLSVFKKILIQSSPMKKEELANTVNALRQELLHHFSFQPFFRGGQETP